MKRIQARTATAAVAMLSAACGGTSSAGSPNAGTAASAPDPGALASLDRGLLRVQARERRAAVVAVAAVALLAAACGGTGPGGSSTGSGSANSKPLAYAQCVRSHGVPAFPDPNSSGGFDKATLERLSASNSQYPAATQACAHLLPNSGGGPTQAQLQQWWTGMANFARCMRTHGVPIWPDPTAYPPDPTRPTFELPTSIQPTPQIIAKMDVCLRLVPNNQVIGHIDNNSWQSAQQSMAGQ